MNQTISARGRAVRLAATLIAGVLLLAGTVWGSDDHFPFGPFLMYAGVNPPNEAAPDPRIDLARQQGDADRLRDPPLPKQLGIGPRLEHDVPRAIDRPGHDQLLI